MSDGLARLQEALDHRFKDPGLLTAALTHRSAGRNGESYERLEFLGDRVLGLVVAQMVYDTYPEEPEGALARRYAALVRGEALAGVATTIGPAPHIRATAAELEDASDNPGILANVCEAVIAAIYLDGGLEPARRFIEKHWRPMMEADRRPPKDSKTELQERMQGVGHPLPRYAVVERSGPSHAPEFTVEVCVAGAAPVRGSGRSRRAAEQEAARAMLRQLGHDQHSDAD